MSFSIIETKEGWVLLELSSRAIGNLLRLAEALPSPEREESGARLAPLAEADSPPLSRDLLRGVMVELVRLLEHHGTEWEARGALAPGPSAETLRETFAGALGELADHAEDALFRVSGR